MLAGVEAYARLQLHEVDGFGHEGDYIGASFRYFYLRAHVGP